MDFLLGGHIFVADFPIKHQN